jgi:catechol 2,3-dioxygenase-like lactoylglutathione lyase family enzyme
VTKRKKYDMQAPGTQKQIDQIVHGAFVTEGTMVAFPPCFPGVTTPVPADECHITALDVAADGMVYAGTGGQAVHLLVGMFHGVTGMVLDLGVVEGAHQTAALCCGQDRFVAAVNGAGGGWLVACEQQPLPFDLIQEWHIGRTPYHILGPAVPGEVILHAVADATRQQVVGVTEGHLFVLDIAASTVAVIGEVPGRARLALGPENTVLGLDEGDTLWAYDVGQGSLQRRAFALPEGNWAAPHAAAMMWARDAADDTLYTADAEGVLYAFTPGQGFSRQAQTPIAPVGPMAVTLDGRLFGTMGEGMSKLFCYDPQSGQLESLGVAVSVFERRRYGYSFGDAAVGRDGEIILGEDDNLGHLWLYFPSVRRRGG